MQILVKWTVFSCILLQILFVCGCSGSFKTEKKKPKTRAAEEKLTATEILDKVVAVYRDCKAYSDEGTVRLMDGQSGKPTTAKFSVKLKRPAFMQVHAYQLEVVSDGQSLKARIQDADTDDFDHQLVHRPIGKTIELADLYTDRELYDAMTRGLAGHPLQLELLLGKEPLRMFRGAGASHKLIASEKFEGHRCHRLLAQNSAGRFVLWIDQNSFLLRKIEFPSIRPDGDPKSQARLKLVAEFRKAKFQVDEPATYQLPPKSQDRHVRFFVRPPQPLPSKLFGQRPATFKFTSMDGKPVSQNQLLGKTVVLSWFNDHALCRDTLVQLNQVRKSFSQDSNVRFLAVAILPATQTNGSIAAMLKGWQTEFETVRDLKAVGKTVFGVNVAPTLVVLNPQGKLQIFQEGMNPNLVSELPQVLKKVSAGQNVAAVVLRDYQAEKIKYNQTLATAEQLAGKKSGTNSAADLNKTAAVAARDPNKVELKKLWECADVNLPGNVLYLSERNQLVVIEDKSRAAILSTEGKVLSRVDLVTKGRSGKMTYLRTWKSKEGKRWFASCAIRGSSVTVFDDQWKRLYVYPSSDQPHEGIGDIQLADLDGDNKPELYVGFWDVVGLHQVIDGKRAGSNRLPSNVVSLAISPPNPVGWHKVLATTNSGRVWRINQYLREDPNIEIAGWAVFRMAGNGQTPSPAPYLGLSYDANDKLNAVALGAKMREAWHYQLPTGVFSNHIQLAQFGRLAKRDVWLLVAPDSSVHLISADGKFNDNFALGKHLTGICLARFGKESGLVTIDGAKLTAWSIKDKDDRTN